MADATEKVKAATKYTVVGFYEDNEQPFMDWVESTDGPTSAAGKAVAGRQDHAVSIVEVLEGHHKGVLGNDYLVKV